MATLEQQRRASGARMEAQRRANGARLEAERRAIGARMEAERRGEDIADDLQSLNGPPPPRRSLPPIPAQGGIPAQRGRGTYVPPAAATGGGLASPLTEKTKVVDNKTVPDRDYWPQGLKSSDGLFVLPAIKSLNLLDANGAEVQIQLASPESST